VVRGGIRLDREGIGFLLSVIGTVISVVEASSTTRIVCGVAGALLIGFFSGIATMRHRIGKRVPHAVAADRLAHALHKRWFPGTKANLDPDYRVSLFVPTPSSTTPEE
jgi:hypothetical protein